MPISRPLSHPMPRPTSVLVRPALALAAALLSVLASLAAVAAVAAVVAVVLVVAGPAHTTGRVTAAEGPAVAPVRTAALASLITGPRYYSHHWATVLRVPHTDPSSPDYTPPVCRREQLLIDTGTYSFGTSFGWQGAAYDKDNLFLHGGFYLWSDCVFASPSGYLQLSRLTLNGTPDDGRHDVAVITHPREVPDWRDADDQGRFSWGSFLSNTDEPA